MAAAEGEYSSASVSSQVCSAPLRTTHSKAMLTDLHRSPRQAPLPAVGALLEQEATASIKDDGGDGGANSDGA